MSRWDRVDACTSTSSTSSPTPLNLPWVVEGAGMDFIELQRTWMADARRELTQLLTAARSTPPG